MFINIHQLSGFEWIDILNPTKEELQSFAKEHSLDFHQIKDSLEAGHLPKIEELKDKHFLILRAYTGTYGNKVTSINEISSKIAIFYNQERVITIHRARFDFLETIPESIVNAEGFIMFLIHKMIKTYEHPAEVLSKKIDDLEQIIFLKDHSRISLEDLYYQKSKSRILKKLLSMTQTVIVLLKVSESNKSSLQDTKDHIISLSLLFDEIVDDTNNLMHSYMSVNAQKSNDVMKLLTVFSAFFLPLTFIAGIYGMNFRNMPELNTDYGYYFTIAAMMIISAVIYLWFKRKKIL
jgi:magnesium transporter